MKLLTKTFVVACVAVVATSTTLAAGPAAPATMSPLLGSWLLDTSRLPMPPDQRPKSVRFTFADAGSNKWATKVDIVYASGEEVHSVSKPGLDGTYVNLDSSPEADHVALTHPVPNVLVMALQQDGVLVSTRIYSVAPDGNNLVETVVYPGNDNTRVMRLNHFTRAL
ncbi:hypothetical protein FHW69_003150 [Luteibacter sp. Sphag1AF]|uniref:hypothetical protein n=1 Tax=Luteibacter sp. Sphag1AF TaxID=2587031 RepID=UPI00160724A1|nr:hypothetical protein [Luteibacter sp. Sphag1AF]MBB3228508.1 hypothetical protein [Luteibacter sp. Sphag1AF]